MEGKKSCIILKKLGVSIICFFPFSASEDVIADTMDRVDGDIQKLLRGEIISTTEAGVDVSYIPDEHASGKFFQSPSQW